MRLTLGEAHLALNLIGSVPVGVVSAGVGEVGVIVGADHGLALRSHAVAVRLGDGIGLEIDNELTLGIEDVDAINAIVSGDGVGVGLHGSYLSFKQQVGFLPSTSGHSIADKDRAVKGFPQKKVRQNAQIFGILAVHIV